MWLLLVRSLIVLIEIKNILDKITPFVLTFSIFLQLIKHSCNEINLNTTIWGYY